MKNRQPNAKKIVPVKRPPQGDWIGLTLLAGVTLFFIAISWRKWPDPVIDFGKELYIPWRLASGAVLYRDVDDPYGPLSPYLNAALFKCFGPGMMVLVAANLAVFAGILAAIYILCRRAWGGAATVAGIVFTSVFGFAQHVRVGNYNYATPYAHQATHGMLVCLLLVAGLVRWIEDATPRRSFFVGLMLGLTAVLKPEFVLAGVVVTIAAGLMRWRMQGGPAPRAIAVGAVGAVLPTSIFVAGFATCLPWKEAILAACKGWLSVTSHLTGERVQIEFTGLDRPRERLIEQATGTLFACLLIALIAGVARLVEHRGPKWVRILVTGALVGGLAWLSFQKINWLESGRCLLGLMLIYACVCAAPFLRKTGPGENRAVLVTRLLLALLAATLMARMFLNGRIYHYGFFQAALAGLMVPAVLIGELPERLRVVRWGRAVVFLASLALFVPGVVLLTRDSQEWLGPKTLAVGKGADLFYAVPAEYDFTGEMVRFASGELLKTPPETTLLVLPEGVMINYLARRVSPVRQYTFYGAETADGGEEQILGKLRERPPDYVVVISRDLRPFGIQRYGDGPGKGGLLLPWVAENYDVVSSIGGDPIDVRQRGGVLLKHKAGR